MPVKAEQAVAMVDSLLAELQRRRPAIREADCYYRGDHPLKFASSQFSDYFGGRYKGFSDNWVQVVADAPVERLSVTGLQPYQAEQADADLWRVWMANGLDADSQLGFLGAVNAARSFVSVWPDPADPETPTVTFEDASQVVVLYKPGSRRERAAGLKHWHDGSLEFVELYLPDQVWQFERKLVSEDRTAERSLIAAADALRGWKPSELERDNPMPNPMGAVPLVELPNRPLLTGDPVSDVTGVISLQDSVNFLWALSFNAADFASFPQRIVLGAERPVTPILDDEGNVIGEKPVPLERFAIDRVLWIPDETATTSNWPAADLEAYTKVIEVVVGHIAAQTRTPAHYLIGRMANLSGDALIAAETGLVKRCEEKQLWFGQALREVFALIALAQGQTAKARAARAGTVLWADAQSRNQAQLADALLKLKQIGWPFRALAARYGLTPPEVEDLVAMREREAALDPVNLAFNGRPDDVPDEGQEPDRADGDA